MSSRGEGERRMPTDTFGPYQLLKGDPPLGIPPAFWRHLRFERRAAKLYVALATLYVSVLFGLLLLRPTFLFGLPLICWLMVGVFQMFFGLTFRWLFRRSKRRYLARISRWMPWVCVYCGYCLNGLPECHVCPECGRPYNIEELEKVWRRWDNRVAP